MSDQRVIEFYKRIGFYNERLYKMMIDNKHLVDSYGSDKSSFYGIYVNDKGNITVVLPKITNCLDEIVWVHEYAHLLFDHDYLNGDETLPSIMEALFINMYVRDKEEIIKLTKKEIKNSKCLEHTKAKELKISLIE